MPVPPDAPLALTLGDPAGIGPEMAARAWEHLRATGQRFVAVGEPAAIAAVWDGPLAVVPSFADGASAFVDALPILSVAEANAPSRVTPGQPTSDGARSALAALTLAADLTHQGQARALVTGPISKAQLHSVGFAHPGQTEFVAARAGVFADDAVMMLAGPTLRVVPLTIHIPLARVPATLTTALIIQRARVVHRDLQRSFGIAAPRIALAGLNPHAGEQGDLGDEEARIMAPAVAALRSEGVAITDPLPADTLFAPHVRTQYDAILCAYHDQALAPFKALHFADGVNVTLGLPIIRTSPDHGTAFDRAGTGTADPAPTLAAIQMAMDIARARAHHAGRDPAA